MTKIYLSGKKTYEVRDKIKAIGGQWNQTQKQWELPIEKETHARILAQQHDLFMSMGA